MKLSPTTPTAPVRVRSFTIHPAISLQEYRERYPRVASIPTLTQRGLIGPLLERLRQKSERLENRRALRKQVWQVLLHPFAGVWGMPGRTTPAQSLRAEPLHA